MHARFSNWMLWGCVPLEHPTFPQLNVTSLLEFICTLQEFVAASCGGCLGWGLWQGHYNLYAYVYVFRVRWPLQPPSFPQLNVTSHPSIHLHVHQAESCKNRLFPRDGVFREGCDKGIAANVYYSCRVRYSFQPPSFILLMLSNKTQALGYSLLVGFQVYFQCRVHSVIGLVMDKIKP